ncbi:MerR family transcriptional regulator [Paenibacillus sp. TRM 82003]|nr:MerR family transcriptional regulator [Paenibacillus sp. TRM 82003]
MKLFKIGELASLCKVSPRTIDYYTKLGLIEPTKRSSTNYRLYGSETLQQLKRIEWLKQQKLTLEEIKELVSRFGKAAAEETVTDRLTALQLHMMQLEREAKEIAPMLEQMKPKQARSLTKSLSPQTAACIEALLLLLGKGPLG